MIRLQGNCQALGSSMSPSGSKFNLTARRVSKIRCISRVRLSFSLIASRVTRSAPEEESPQLYEFGADVPGQEDENDSSRCWGEENPNLPTAASTHKNSLIIIPVNLCSNEALIAVTVLGQFIIAIGPVTTRISRALGFSTPTYDWRPQGSRTPPDSGFAARPGNNTLPRPSKSGCAPDRTNTRFSISRIGEIRHQMARSSGNQALLRTLTGGWPASEGDVAGATIIYRNGSSGELP